MGFSTSIKEKALVKSRRCCCICHNFAGVYSNVHHIKPTAQKGPDTIDNAIVLCLRCHGEVGHYNPKHPIGNKYTRNELKEHRNKWWDWCEKDPHAPLPGAPVIISPNEFLLSAGEWSSLVELDIFNKTDSFIYQTWIKILIESMSIKTRDLIASSDAELKGDSLNLGNIELFTQIYRVNANDSHNNEVLFFVLDKLEPKGHCHIQLTVAPSAVVHAGDKLIFNVSSFDGEPSRKHTKKNNSAVSFSFIPPETLTKMDLSVVMRLTQKK